MTQTPPSLGDGGLLRKMLNAMPSFIFAVDDDVRIIEYNQAAGELLHQQRDEVLLRRGGEVLHCLHALDTPQGCGRGEFCQSCVIRNSVNEAYLGNHVVRRRARMEVRNNERSGEFYCLVTASPFHYLDRKMVLLVLEDISELAELQRIIPICMNCRKIRDDDQLWQRVEAYFDKHWDLRFSHGMCPECAKVEMAKLKREIPPGV